MAEHHNISGADFRFDSVFLLHSRNSHIYSWNFYNLLCFSFYPKINGTCDSNFVYYSVAQSLWTICYRKFMHQVSNRKFFLFFFLIFTIYDAICFLFDRNCFSKEQFTFKGIVCKQKTDGNELIKLIGRQYGLLTSITDKISAFYLLQVIYL